MKLRELGVWFGAGLLGFTSAGLVRLFVARDTLERTGVSHSSVVVREAEDGAVRAGWCECHVERVDAWQRVRRECRLELYLSGGALPIDPPRGHTLESEAARIEQSLSRCGVVPLELDCTEYPCLVVSEAPASSCLGAREVMLGWHPGEETSVWVTAAPHPALAQPPSGDWEHWFRRWEHRRRHWAETPCRGSKPCSEGEAIREQ
jgi:hypothetical protein